MNVLAVPLGELMPPKKRSIDPRKSPDEEFELFSIPAFDAGKPEIISGKEIGSSKQVLERGDVLLSKIVPHIRRAWIVEPDSDRPTIGSSEWIIFRSDRFVPAYLRHALVSDRFHQAFMQTVAGVGGSLLRARPSYVADVEVPLPPIEEQRRIAAVLDAADALRAKRRQALAKLDSLVEAIFIDMFGDLLNSTFESIPFGSLLQQPLRNGISPAKSGSVVGVVLTLSAITGSYFEHTELKESTFARAHPKEKTVSPEDFLICRGNGNLSLVGRGKYPDRSMPGVAFPDTMIAARCDPGIVSRGYVARVWNDRVIRGQLERLARTTNGTHKINQSMIESIEMPLPPVDLQREFDRAEEATISHRADLECTAERLEVLFASLQQRAFRGES